MIEMLVVIGIIAIVTVSALPSLRGIYREFKINQTIEETDELVSAYRSYYLIMNEFPADTNSSQILDSKSLWCMPQNCYSASSNKYSVQPYEGSNYDFEQWTNSPNISIGAIVLTLRGISEASLTEKYRTKLANLYPQSPLKVENNTYLYVIFPELTVSACNSVTASFRNQYR